jgi:RES domain-containing protein
VALSMTLWTRPPDRVAGVWTAYRHTDRRFAPLWYGGGAKSLRQESGRWHEEGSGVAQYLALSSNGAWAERCRYAHIRDDVRRLEDRRRLWQLQVVEHDIADLSTFDAYAHCDLEPELAVGPHQHAWPLAAQLRAAGYRGVLSPAAAYDRPDAVNLTLFGERIDTERYGAMPEPAENPRPDMYVVAILIADSGSPTRYAMRHTCYEDAYHEQLSRWRRSHGRARGSRRRP